MIVFEISFYAQRHNSLKSVIFICFPKIIQAMELHASPYVDQLLQLFLMTIKDQDDEVISNSVFALGVLAEIGKESVAKYPLSEVR